METDRTTSGAGMPGVAEAKELLAQYGYGSIQFTGTDDALYERHIMFDNVVDASAVGPRERYEAVARSVRDVLSQRWLCTDQTYEHENPNRVYLPEKHHETQDGGGGPRGSVCERYCEHEDAWRLVGCRRNPAETNDQ
jgi:hypothetical protein